MTCRMAWELDSFRRDHSHDQSGRQQCFTCNVDGANPFEFSTLGYSGLRTNTLLTCIAQGKVRLTEVGLL